MRRGPLVLGAAVAVAAVATGVLVVRDDGSGGRSVDASVRCSAGDVDALDLSDPDQGEPAWSEEFDGAGRGRAGLDPQRWTVRDATTLSFDQARIRADNVSVADGTLRIT
ncbi:MAG: hypothetical protein EON53_15540, partial [Actinomycetales bacterium]